MTAFSLSSHYLIITLLICLVIQGIFFLIASRLRSDVFTDITYALTFIALAMVMLVGMGTFQTVSVLLTGLIVVWGVRLGVYMLVRIVRIGRDERFDGIRESPRRFGMFWLLQGLSIWVILLPSLRFLADGGQQVFGPVVWVGTCIWFLGFGLESIADWQKSQFRSQAQNNGRFIQTGLWRFARHPNYFGEMLCWWGLFVIIAPSLQGIEWLVVVGPVYLTFLLRYGTGVANLAKKQHQKYGQLPEFQHYLRTTRMFVPWFWPKRDALGTGAG